MREYRPSRCRSCGKKIRWVRMENGSVIPVDYDEKFHGDFQGPKGKMPMFDEERMIVHSHKKKSFSNTIKA